MQADDELLGAGDDLEAAPDGNRLEPLGGSYSEGLQKLIGFADGPEEWRETETVYWVAFDVAAIGLTGPKLLAIHEKVHSLERFWHTDGAILLELGRREELGLQFLNQELVNRIVEARKRIDPHKLGARLKEMQVTALPGGHPRYPFCLRSVHYPPAVLYIKGQPDFIRLNKAIGIVGTRNPTTYGQKVAKQFAAELASRGVMVISGMAFGIDSISHWGAIEAGGATIAVLGSGPDHIYPATNRHLYNKMLETPGCAIVSEYFPGTKPQPWMFPQRNRIISGLSQGLLVVEAGQKSGSLSTAHQAFDQGRLVFAIPGRIDMPASQGTNHLIHILKARLVVSVDEIIAEFPWITGKYENKPVQVELFGREKEVFDLIAAEPLIHFDKIAELMQMPAGELSSALIMLELAGAVERMNGDLYQTA